MSGSGETGSDAGPRRPRAVRLAPVSVGPGPSAEAASDRGGAGAAPPAPAASIVELTADPFRAGPSGAGEKAIERAQAAGLRRRSMVSWSGLLWSALGGLASLAAGLWMTRLIDDAFARAPALGIVGLVLAGFAALALLVLGAREVAAIGRQRRIATLHADAADAHAADDQEAARRLLADLAALYERRPATARARSEVLSLRNEIIDARDLLEIAERSLVAPLDREAAAAVAGAARRVSTVTALAPRAIIDVVFVVLQAVRLMRLIAEIYGGRPGLYGFLRLARSVASHVAITGGMAAGDTLVQQLVGHGIAAKLSARLGEGVLNGLLTARIGLSAIAVCRPMPFAAERPPTLRTVVPFLLRAGDEKSGKNP